MVPGLVAKRFHAVEYPVAAKLYVLRSPLHSTQVMVSRLRFHPVLRQPEVLSSSRPYPEQLNLLCTWHDLYISCEVFIPWRVTKSSRDAQFASVNCHMIYDCTDKTFAFGI